MKEFICKSVTSMILVGCLSLTSCVGVLARSYDDSLVESVEYVYDYIDANQGFYDNRAIESVRKILLDMSYGRASADINESDVSALSNGKATNEEVADLLKYTLSVYCSVSGDDMKNNLTAARSKVGSVLADLEIEADDWFSFFVTTRKESQANIHARYILAKGSSFQGEELYNTMDELQIDAMEAFADANTGLAGAFAKLGWTPRKIVAACRAIMNRADKNATAEFALLKAAARSGMWLSLEKGKSAVSSEDDYKILKENKCDLKLKYAGNNLNDENNFVILKPGSTNTFRAWLDFENNQYEHQVNNVSGVVGYYTSNRNLVDIDEVKFGKDRGYAQLKVSNTLKGYSDIYIKRDPEPSYYAPGLGHDDWNKEAANEDWLIRFRIIVPHEIGVTSKIEWNNNSVLSWTAVPNAQKYNIELYKNDSYFKTVSDVKATQYDFSGDIAGAGAYKVKIKAFGTGYGELLGKGEDDKRYEDVWSQHYEVGDWSSYSPEKIVLDVVEPISPKPVWDGYNVKWTAAPGADSYKVNIYRDGVLIDTKTTTSTSVDVTDLFTENGDYTAKVIVVKGEKQSVESEPTDVKNYIQTVKLKGKVRLQYANSKSAFDNAHLAFNIVHDEKYPYYDEAIITMKGTSYRGTSDENGEYEIADLIKGETYTINFARDSFLTRSITFLANEDLVRNIDLYYGDFTSATGSANDVGNETIDGGDLAYFLYRLYKNKENNPDIYNARPHIDFNNDGMVDTNEFFTVLSNIGRTTKNPHD